jgi:hypothetical protein
MKDAQFLNSLPEPQREEARHRLVLLRALQNKDEEGFKQELRNRHHAKTNSTSASVKV